MSFSTDVKNELIKNELEKNCCKKSMLYGMALFSKEFSFEGVSFQSENEASARLFKRLLAELCNVRSGVKSTPSGKSFSVDISQESACSKIMAFFGHTQNETSLKINFSNFTCSNCYNAFLAGVFLACGSVSSPEKDYHLELSVAYYNLSKSLLTLMQELELEPKTTKRKGYNIIYFKDSEAIEDCLYLMGASASMFNMMNVKIVKEIRNSANRRANCETANIEKTVRAASPQLEAIIKIKKKKGLAFLSPSLREMAEKRLENPDLSLSELAELFEPPLSRSGANHRLKRIVEIAQEL
ncbi:MAG: DNA-binding protein WhiA [Eubacterium sp.]|nr:DNA-binding protein WhiA [Eubacterium sp.]MBR6392932.1 DNA-binding protein WhiA [Eubacterium sp.]MBR7072405.1 DNA-binding protein WhiA [Eubacterium sp.]